MKGTVDMEGNVPTKINAKSQRFFIHLGTSKPCKLPSRNKKTSFVSNEMTDIVSESHSFYNIK